MEVLRNVQPTRDQLVIIDQKAKGVLVVRGAAGSGKTTTALIRLRRTVPYWQRRVRDGYMQGPVNVLVLTYNRTLRGYIAELAQRDITGVDASLTVSTFAKWARQHCGTVNLVNDSSRAAELRRLGASLGWTESFLISEVDYVTGRFRPSDLEDYLDCDRDGRGITPRVTKKSRRRLLDEVIYPYGEWKGRHGVIDWSDIANQMADQISNSKYHVVVVDEAQDFSANQVRAIMKHVDNAHHSVTFVLDAAQRIYPQRFTWAEAGVEVRSADSKKLLGNFRNTAEIAAFTASLLMHVEVTDDASVPDLSSCISSGDKPILISGTFTQQMDHVVRFLSELNPDARESVAILHAKGHAWFDYVRNRLDQAGFSYVEMTRRSEWPNGTEQIALSTMHSVKGLEFDHVIIVGVNAETMPHGAEPGDSERDAHLRLMAMAAGRARKTVRLTYKATEASDLIDCIDPETYVREEM